MPSSSFDQAITVPGVPRWSLGIMSEYEIELILKKAHTVLGEADDALEARLSPRQCGV